MTEPGDSADPTPEPARPASADPQAPTETTEGDNGNREAARWRARLRATESQRDQLAERIQRMQRADIERLVDGRLAVPGDLFAFGGLTVEDLVDEDGDVNPARVTDAVTTLLALRPGLRSTPPSPRGPMIPGHVPSGPQPGSGSWTDVLRTPGNY